MTETTYNVDTVNGIATKAATELDDRKSKLAFGKLVNKASATGVSNEIFAEILTTARVNRVYPGTTDSAEIARLAKSDKLNMSSSMVSNYGTTLNQLTESTAPVNESTFGWWFSLVTKPGSAKVRATMMAELKESPATDEEKSNVIRATAENFKRTPVQRDTALTLEKVLKFLAEVANTDFGSDTQAVSDALFEFGAIVADNIDVVESETVDA